MTHGYVLTAGQVMKLIMIDISIVRIAVKRLNGVRNNMNVLEKILEEIEKEQNSYEADHAWNYSKGMEYAKEIIRSHMDHSGDDTEMGDWISVDVGLPEVPEGLADEYCPEFNVTIKGAERTTTLKYSWDGTWFDDNGNVYNVIAWQPLPKPYKPKKVTAAGMEHIMSRFTKVE